MTNNETPLDDGPVAETADGSSEVAASCHGVNVPASRFLSDTRIRRINAGRYEGQEITGALHVVRPDDRVLEIGAGIGLVGAIIANIAKPQKVASFEANPELIPVIRQLYEMNGLQERISVRNAVLVSGPERPATMPFHLRSSYLGSSLLNPSERPSRVVEVPTEDLAQVCEALKPTVLVMDIEGGELDLLQHMDLSPFRAVILEFHPEVYGVPGMRACKRVLRDAGFAKEEAVSTRTVWTCLRQGAAQDAQGS